MSREQRELESKDQEKCRELLDQFAGMALQGEFVSQSWRTATDNEIARRCYNIARAMMQERDRQ